MYEVLPTLFPDLRLLGSSKAGIVEEVGKLVGLIILLNALPEVAFKYRLNALLIGAAVGAGFDAFESAGYAFDTFLFASPSKFSQIISNETVLNIHMRGILAPFTHMAWTAIAASAYWQAKKLHGTTVAALTSWHFLKLFLIAVVLHMVWDVETDYDLLKILVLCIIAYVLTSKLIRLGFKELESVPADAPLKATS
jgi:RsiW-degrading membrane proteinase PrsW (M82 family)